MTKDELIAKQQLQIEEYKTKLRDNLMVKRELIGSLYSIGAPLNDNLLKFNKDQLKWLMSLGDKINEIATLKSES